jgi:hypothetical protein
LVAEHREQLVEFGFGQVIHLVTFPQLSIEPVGDALVAM